MPHGSTAPIRIVQLSDTHFLEPDAEPEGGGAYDTSAAFEAVRDHIAQHASPDMFVVTGDVADHGRRAQYELAAEAFVSLDGPVNVCPGNHDFFAPLEASIGRPNVSTSRAIELGDWAFLFVESSAGIMQLDSDGQRRDPDDGERLHNNGRLGPAETAWIERAHDMTTAPHVFVWIHHPPNPKSALSFDADYAAEWEQLAPSLPKVRGLGAGHTHIPTQYRFAELPIFVAPSLKTNFDLDARTWLPPGYRSYSFHADGSVESEVHLVDDQRWPRRPMGRAIYSLFTGELTYEQLDEIVRRKAAEK